MANQVEEVHAELFKGALKALEKGEDLEAEDYYVCGVCGNTVEGSPPEKCPVCKAPEDRFTFVEEL